MSAVYYFPCSHKTRYHRPLSRMEQVKLGFGPSSSEILECLATSPKRSLTMSRDGQQEEMAKLRSSLSWLENIDENDIEFDLEEERPSEEESSLKVVIGGGRGFDASGWIGAEVHHQGKESKDVKTIIKEGWLTKEGNRNQR